MPPTVSYARNVQKLVTQTDKIKSKSAQDILLLFGVAMLFTGRHAELAVKLAGEGQGTP